MRSPFRERRSFAMTKTESRAEVFFMAFQSLSEAERRAVAARLLDDPKLREDLLDIALIREQKAETSALLEVVEKRP